MRRYIKEISLLFTIIVCLTGCWDYQDINERSIIISVGVDTHENKVLFSGEIARLKSLQQSADEIKTTDTYTFFGIGKDFNETNMDIARKQPFPLFLGAVRTTVFSEDFAKEGIEPYLNRINSLYDYRKDVLAVISREPTKMIFETPVENDISIGFLVEDIIRYMDHRGRTVYTSVGKILSVEAQDNTAYVMPYIGREQNKITYLGLAVMKDSKMIDVIDINKAYVIPLVYGQKIDLMKNITLPKAENSPFSFRLNRKKRKITTEYENEKIIIKVDLKLTAQLQYREYREPIDEASIKALEKAISEMIEKDISEMIKKTQEDYNADIFRFLEIFKSEHPRVFRNIDWRKEYKRAHIQVKVDTRITNQNLRDYNAQLKFKE